MGRKSDEFNIYSIELQPNGKYNVVRMSNHGTSTADKGLTLDKAKKRADELNRLYGS